MHFFLHILEEQTEKKINILFPKNIFRMAVEIKMATKTKFASKNYKLSFFKKKFRAVLVV
jgi:hypothetical protein